LANLYCFSFWVAGVPSFFVVVGATMKGKGQGGSLVTQAIGLLMMMT
jgi:hypothetical protein